MGLGPPVCTKCKVIGVVTPKDDPRYGATVPWGASYWHCPICDTPKLDNHLWEYPQEQQDEIEGNTLFLKFMKGIE